VTCQEFHDKLNALILSRESATVVIAETNSSDLMLDLPDPCAANFPRPVVDLILSPQEADAGFQVGRATPFSLTPRDDEETDDDEDEDWDEDDEDEDDLEDEEFWDEDYEDEEDLDEEDEEDED
jgi:hypothetical protein